MHAKMHTTLIYTVCISLRCPLLIQVRQFFFLRFAYYFNNEELLSLLALKLYPPILRNLKKKKIKFPLKVSPSLERIKTKHNKKYI